MQTWSLAMMPLGMAESQSRMHKGSADDHRKDGNLPCTGWLFAGRHTHEHGGQLHQSSRDHWTRPTYTRRGRRSHIHSSCLSVYLFIYQSIYSLAIELSVHLSIYVSIYLPAHLLATYPSIYPCIHLFTLEMQECSVSTFSLIT